METKKEMEVKEAIEYLNKLKRLIKEGKCVDLRDDMGCHEYYEQLCLKDNINSIISLLQQGEAYQQIVKDLEKNYGYYYWGSMDNLSQLIPRLEQKYFPKEAKNES